MVNCCCGSQQQGRHLGSSGACGLLRLTRCGLGLQGIKKYIRKEVARGRVAGKKAGDPIRAVVLDLAPVTGGVGSASPKSRMSSPAAKAVILGYGIQCW
jgi:hypothetical protein